MRLRHKRPTWENVIVLPDFSRYRKLHDETVRSLTASQIAVRWVNEGGVVDGP